MKTRYDFTAMQAAAIVLIVLYHIDGSGFVGSMGVLSPLFSAMVAVFVFIAGYFSAAKAAEAPLAHAKRKFKSLIVPLYSITLLYAAIVFVLHRLGAPRGTVSWNSILVDPLVGGHKLSYNLPMWFIAPLYFCEVVYAFTRKCTRGGIWSTFPLWPSAFLQCPSLLRGIASRGLPVLS